MGSFSCSRAVVRTVAAGQLHLVEGKRISQDENHVAKGCKGSPQNVTCRSGMKGHRLH